MSRPLVRVSFVDDANGATLGEAELSPSWLPPSFEPETTLHLGDDDWQVVRAEPARADEYIAAGVLRLTLRHAPQTAPSRLDPVSPGGVVFTVATLAEPAPAPSGPRPTEGRVLELRQDEWRQIELVSASLAPIVASEIAAIERVTHEARVPRGFRTVHARGALTEPLADAAALTLETLVAVFPARIENYAAVALAGDERALADAFGFRTRGELTVYGLASAGRVTVLGLRPDRSRRGPPADARALAALRREHGLLLVDWCARTVVAPPANVPAPGN